MGEIRDLAISFLEWLPLDRAAKYLSTTLDQELTEVELLGLARQKLLTLSVHFPNLAKVRYGEIIHYPRSQFESARTSADLPRELEWVWLSPEEALALPDLPREAEGRHVLVIRNLKIDDDHYVRFPGKVRTIEGVWDLPMIGGERLEIEKELQRLTGRSPITCQALEGVIVRGIDGTLCQLQEQFHFSEYSAAWNEERRQLKQQIANEEIELEEGQRLLDMHKEERNQYLKMVKQVDSSECYYPARNFPQDSYLVIRREALAKFQELALDLELKSCSPKTGGGQHDSHQSPCKPVCAEQIIRHFKVKADPEENADWWRNKMRNALDYGLAECRVGGGRPGPGGSLWRPDCIAAWLVDRHKKGLEGLSEKAAWAALRKFPGCEGAADVYFSLDG